MNKHARMAMLLGAVGFILLYWVLSNTDDASNRLMLLSTTPQNQAPASSAGLGDAHTATRHTHTIEGATGTEFTGDKVRRWNGDIPADLGQDGPALDFPRDRKCARWGVVTTINAPTPAVIGFSQLPDWCLVVVADRKTPPYQHPKLEHSDRMVLLGAPQQQALAKVFPRLFALLPWNHFGRKNIGYLYAIAHGAEYVWDFDDDNEMISPFSKNFDPSVLEETIRVKQHLSECNVFNPYPRLGASTSPCWPRGYPLQYLNNPCSVDYESSAVPEAELGVVQAVANHDPDVDAIYRLSQRLPITFTGNETLVLPKGMLAPYNAQATLVLKPALWSLLLPISVNGRVSDIWRSYVAQRLMWDVDLKLAFSPPRVKQVRNTHSYIADLEAEQPLYLQSAALTKMLAHWQPDSSTGLTHRFVLLWVEMYEREFVEEQDVLLAIEWMRALTGLRYAFPSPNLADRTSPTHAIQAQPAVRSHCPRGRTTRIMVTGVSGLIGSHVARVLLEDRCNVVYGLVRPRSNLYTLIGVLRLSTLKFVVGDISDAGRMEDLVADIRPDYVYHFAAQAINGLSYDQAQLTMQLNVAGTLNMLEAVRRLAKPSCRFIFAGSSTAYGRTADVVAGAPLKETDPLEPVTPYGVSKVAAENLVRQYYLTHGIQGITLRFFLQIGAGGTDSLAVQQFCKQIAMAERGLAPRVISHGNLETFRDMTDVRQSAVVVVDVAQRGVPGEAYNVGTGQSVSISKLLEVAVSLANVPVTSRVDPARYRLYDEKVLLADITKVRQLTGTWNPELDLRDTVGVILNSWRNRVQFLYPERPADKLLTGTKPRDQNAGTKYRDKTAAIVVRTTAKFSEVASNVLIHTARMFLDQSRFPLEWVLDQEKEQDHAYGACLRQNGFRVSFAGLPEDHKNVFHGKSFGWPYNRSGYTRQQWSTLYFDHYSDAEIIGVLDTDSQWFRTFTMDDIMDESGRIYVRAIHHDKQEYPHDEKLLGFNTPGLEFMWGNRMPHFFFRETFANMRRHIDHVHNMSATDAWKKISRGPVCPNCMLNMYAVTKEPHRYRLVLPEDDFQPPSVGSNYPDGPNLVTSCCLHFNTTTECHSNPESVAFMFSQQFAPTRNLTAADRHLWGDTVQRIRRRLAQLPPGVVEGMRQACAHAHQPPPVCIQPKDSPTGPSPSAHAEEKQDVQWDATAVVPLEKFGVPIDPATLQIAFPPETKRVVFEIGLLNNPEFCSLPVQDPSAFVFGWEPNPISFDTIHDRCLSDSKGKYIVLPFAAASSVRPLTWNAKETADACASINSGADERVLKKPSDWIEDSTQRGLKTCNDWIAANPNAPLVLWETPYNASSSEAVAKMSKIAMDNCLICKNQHARGANKLTRVATLPLEAIITKIPNHIEVDFVRIDAQGADLNVFSSAGAQKSRIRRVELEVQDLPVDHPDILYSGPFFANLEMTKKFMEEAGFPFVQCRINNCACREFNCVFAQREIDLYRDQLLRE